MARSSRPVDGTDAVRHGREMLARTLLILGLAACGDELRIDVTYEVVGRVPVENGACGAAETAPPEAAGATIVRFTFRDHTPAGPGPLRCDVAIDRAAAAPVIAVPRRDEPVDVWVEYFAADGTLVARGSRAGVDLTSRDRVRIHAGPPDTFTCAPAQSTAPRAFHSATRMPGGEVLLIGGLVDPPGPEGDDGFSPAEGAYVTGTAEIYDPRSDRVTPISIPGLSPRAFHDVVVLGVAGDVVTLVIAGGIGVNGNPAAPGNVAAIGGPGGEAPWRTVDADNAMRAGSVAPPPELLAYSMSTRAITRTPLAEVPSRFFTTGGVDDAIHGQPRVIAGGRGESGDRADVLSPAGAIEGTLTGVRRVGSTIVATSASTALWIGGDLGGTRLYDELRQLDAQPALVAGPAPPPGSNRAFGAGARVGADVLFVGGLEIGAAGINDATPAPAAHWITAGGVAAVTAPDLVPAAYPAVAQLPDGDVLVTGGAVAGAPGCGATLSCPAAHAVRVGASVARAVSPPGLMRYGHRLTRLADGTVLISGGFTTSRADPARVRPLATLEHFEPHDAGDDPLADLGLTRAPGEVAMADGAPVAPCTLVVAGAGADAAGADAMPSGVDAEGSGVDAAAAAAAP